VRSVLAAALACACVEQGRPVDGGIAVGALLPFSGVSAEQGSALERGLILAIEQLNDAGGVQGQPLRLEVRDSYAARGRLAAVLEELVSEGIVALVGPPEVELMREARGRLAPTGVPIVLASSATLQDLRSDEGTPLFPLAPPAELVACAMANRIYQDGVRRLAVIHATDPYSIAFAEGLVSAFESFRLSASVAEGSAVPLSADRRQTLEAVSDLSPEAVALVTSAQDTAAVIFDASSMGERPPWYLGLELLSAHLVSNTPPGALNGAFGVEIAVPEDSARFAELYRQRWSGEEPPKGAYFTYDAGVLVGLSAAAAARDGATLTPGGLGAEVERMANAPGASLSWEGLADGLRRVALGEDVNYSGASGSVTLGSLALEATTDLIRFTEVEGAQIVPETYGACPAGTLEGL
jgi:ABC-type branched-subunit amino acid transport system substrate-binding protein